MPELNNSKGIKYLKETRFKRATIRDLQRPAIAETEYYKTYPGAETVKLFRQWHLQTTDIQKILQARRSIRKYSTEPMSLDELSFILWAGHGITGQAGRYFFRAAPSGGALYPVEAYININNVTGVLPGLYHLDVMNFQLERLSEISLADSISSGYLDQQFMAQGAVIFLWTAIFRRNMCKYGHRGMRYILMDAGHICQNVLLAGEAVGCGGCPVAALYDSEVNEILGVDGDEESAVYAASIGKKQ